MKYISVILLLFGLSIGLVWLLDVIQGFDISYTIALLKTPFEMLEPSDYLLLVLFVGCGYITNHNVKGKTD